MIKVLLVDDDPSCREGIRQLVSLTPDLEVVGEASSSEEAFELGRRLQPDVVVIDADLPCESCVEAIQRLSDAEATSEPGPSFICLAVYPDQHEAALQAGATRFMRKDGTGRELLDAIRAAANRPGR